MSESGKKKEVSMTPLRTPSPDTANRNMISVTLSPELKLRGIHSRSNSSSNVLIQEISKLRKENHRLREQMIIMRSNLRQKYSINKAEPQITQIDNYEEQSQTKRQQGQEPRVSFALEKDILISRLKGEVNSLQKKLNQVTLIDSDRLSKLQKQNKSLKDVIALNLEFDQQNLKKVNQKLQFRISELQSENYRYKELAALSGDPGNVSFSCEGYEHIFNQIQSIINAKYEDFLEKCDNAESRMFRFQNQIESIKNRVEQFKRQQPQQLYQPTSNMRQTQTQTEQCPMQKIDTSSPMSKLQSIYKEELEQKSNTLTNLHGIINSLNTQIVSYKEQISLLTSQLHPTPDDSSISEQLENKQIYLSNIIGQNTRIKEDNEMLRQTIQALVREKQEDRLGFQQEIDGLQARNKGVIQGHSKQTQGYLKEINQNKNQIEYLRRVNQETVERLKELENKEGEVLNDGRLKEQNEVIRELKSHIEQLQSGNDELREDIKKFQDMLINVQSIVESTEQEKAALSNNLLEHQLYIKQLDQEMDEKDKLLQQLLYEVNSTKDTLNRINLEPLENQCKSLFSTRQTDQGIEKQRRIRELESKLMELEHRNVSLQYFKQSALVSTEYSHKESASLSSYVEQLKSIIDSYSRGDNHGVGADKELLKCQELEGIRANLRDIQDHIIRTQGFIQLACNGCVES